MLDQAMNIHTHYITLRRKLISILPYAEVIHVGSTAILGIKTKGDLDINVRVNKRDFSKTLTAIKKLGYHEKNGTLQTNTLRHFKPDKEIDLDVAIQVTVYGSKFDVFVLFGEILRHNKNAKMEYQKIKSLYGKISDVEYREKKSRVINKYLGKVVKLV